jgi:hypothetical protein
MSRKKIEQVLDKQICDNVIDIIYEYTDKTCMQCDKKLIENPLKEKDYKEGILYHKDNIWCDMKNSKWKKADVCNWCYYYVWRPV